jgi:AcrR family transcriptional regulator
MVQSPRSPFKAGAAMHDLANSRRSQILDVAERLLHHYGHAKTTVAEIAREAGISVGSVYLEFAGKDAIWIELSHRRHEAVLAAMRGAAQAPRKPWSQRLLGVWLARTRAFLALADGGAHAAELVQCNACPVIREAQEQYRRRERELVADLLRDADAAGEFAVRDPDATAAVLLQALIAFVPPLVFSRPRDDLERDLGALNQIFVHGLARSGDLRPRG